MAEQTGKTYGNQCSGYEFPCLEDLNNNTQHGRDLNAEDQGRSEDRPGSPGKELEEIEKSAFEKAYKEIFRQSIEEQRATLQRVQAIVNHQQQAWENLNCSLERKIYQKIIEGGFELARAVIAKALDAKPSLVKNVVGRAISLARANSNIVVKTHAEDWQIVSEMIEAIKSRRRDLGTIHVESDNTIERGGCLIETDYGIIDARIGSQLDVIRRAVES